MASLKQEMTLVCERCGDEFTHEVSFGRKPRWCDSACRFAAKRERKSGSPSFRVGDVATRTCKQCGDAFTHLVVRGGPRWYCDPCGELRRCESRKQSAPSVEYLREYRERNKEELKRRVARKYLDNPEKLLLVRYRNRCHRYGIVQAHHEAMIEIQGNRCACCRREADPSRQFAIDHDHDCCDRSVGSCGSCVRGLLCWHCNTNRLTDEMVLHKAAYILYWRHAGRCSGAEHLEMLRRWIVAQSALINIEPVYVGVEVYAQSG